jgi:hypothetical protein
MSQYAEAAHRIGLEPVFAYLDAAARDVGWPIPPAAREQVVLGVVLLVQAVEVA